MKVKFVFLVGLFLAFGFSGISYSNGTPVGVYSEWYTLYAGQTIDVGQVGVGNDGDSLYIMFKLSDGIGGAIGDGWRISETHVHVGLAINNLTDFPLNKKGNPKIGNFDYSMVHNPYVTWYEYVIDLHDLDQYGTWNFGDKLNIAAHCVVNNVLSEVTYSDIYGAVTGDGIYKINVELGTADIVSLPIDGKNADDGLGHYIDVDNGTGYINAIALDAINDVLYFTSPASPNRGTRSPLWSLPLNNNPDKFLNKLGLLSTETVVGACFHEGYYYYMEDYSTELRRLNPLSIVDVNPADGCIDTELVYDFYGKTSKDFTFGDFEISKNGILYGSTRVSPQMFYSVDLSNGNFYEYPGAQATDLQLAFGSNTILYGQRHRYGEWFKVDVSNGNTIPIGSYFGGKQYWDLASGYQYDQVSETAWGNGTPFVTQGGSWAMYFGYTLTSVPVPPVPPVGNWSDETAWGGMTEGDGKAWWYYFDVSAGNPQEYIYAGQERIDGAKVEYKNGELIITLGPNMMLQQVADNVKIECYSDSNLPDKRPAAGGFTYKYTEQSDTASLVLKYTLPACDNYAIHLDVWAMMP